MIMPTVYMVTDIETTMRQRIAFDIAWKGIDRRGKEYCTGSHIVTDALKLDVPYFKEKLGWYFSDTYKHMITPLSMSEIRDIYNSHVEELLNRGHKVVFCAYNAGFDAKYLSETSIKLIQQRFLMHKIQLLDIWQYWCESAPQLFNYVTPKGNPKTSAEAVYKYEMHEPEFAERHIAFSDVEIEAELLLKVLRRKKPIPLVNTPAELMSSPWRLLKDREIFKGAPDNGRVVVIDR